MLIKLILSIIFTLIVSLISDKVFEQSFNYVESVTLILAYYIFFSQKD